MSKQRNTKKRRKQNAYKKSRRIIFVRKFCNLFGPMDWSSILDPSIEITERNTGVIIMDIKQIFVYEK
jgi:hypothetical protein